MANDLNIEARAKLEWEFISSAFCGIAYNTVDAGDILAVCPVNMLQEGRQPHQIYESIEAVYKSGSPVNLDTLYTYINKRFMAEKKTASSIYPKITIDTLANMFMSLYGKSQDAIFHYAHLMRNEGLKRQAENALYPIISQCQQYANDAGDIANDVLKVYSNMSSYDTDKDCNDLSELMERVKQSMLPTSGSKPMPLPYENMNKVLCGGFGNGELVILAARPGMGKTALAGCIALERARQGGYVLFVSLEVKDITLGQRLVAREGQFDVSYFRFKENFNDSRYDMACKGADSIAKLPLKIKERSTRPITPSEVRRMARAMPFCDLVVVDYLQLLTPDTRQNSREREVAEMSRAMKQLALELNCPVLLLSQLNRAMTQTEREPQLSDLRESGAIEQDADIVIFLHAKKADLLEKRMPLKAIIAKGRSSGTGEANLVFNKPFCDFAEDTDGSYWNQPATANDGWDL